MKEIMERNYGNVLRGGTETICVVIALLTDKETEEIRG